MRLDDLDPTDNARDLGSGGGGGGGFGLLGLLPLFLGRRMGCGGIALLGVVAIVYFMFAGGGGGGMLGSAGGPVGQSRAPGGTACDTEAELFACRVMTLANATWDDIFAAAGASYQRPTINFYQGGAQSGCGFASSAAGPFYCPRDAGIYLDTGFFDELAQNYGAAGDFAQAYVIAHEVGHHVQNLTGIAGEVTRAQQQLGEAEGNALSVRLELQADCYAGVWAARNRERLEPGDIEEGLTAANAIGDDTLQRQHQGSVVPDSFTHGTSQQRMEWLRRGLESGDQNACNTFDAAL